MKESRRFRAFLLEKGPTILALIVFIIYCVYVWGVECSESIVWSGNSVGFVEVSKSILEFSSIVLGVYGFLFQ